MLSRALSYLATATSLLFQWSVIALCIFAIALGIGLVVAAMAGYGLRNLSVGVPLIMLGWMVGDLAVGE